MVEVSPSTVMLVEGRGHAHVESAFCSMAGATWRVGGHEHSMVAMLGWIMPEPLAMPPDAAGLAADGEGHRRTPLDSVSVVMMAVAASWLPSGVRGQRLGGGRDARSKGSMFQRPGR